MRVGRIPYVNCYPVYGAIDRGLVALNGTLVDGVPSALNRRMADGTLDIVIAQRCAPSPSGSFLGRVQVYFRAAPGVHYAFLMPDSAAREEALGENAVIEHVPAFKFPGHWEYRLAPPAGALRDSILKHRPDVIEVGSPYLLPGRIRRIVKSLPVVG